MNCLEKRILKDGVVKPGNVLKVDSFLNHQMDIGLMNEIGEEFCKRFSDAKINKILWIAMIGSLLLTTAVLEIPFLATAFGFVPVGLTEYCIALGLGFVVIPVVEIVKFFQRRAAK